MTKDRGGLRCKPKLTERQELRQLTGGIGVRERRASHLGEQGSTGQVLDNTWENKMQLD